MPERAAAPAHDAGSEALVVLESVSMASVEGAPLFERLDFRLARGARVRVDAARGAGGTALLRLCAGLAHPESGRVLLDGAAHDPDGFAHPYLRAGRVGWIPHEGALVANLTLLGNVALPVRYVAGETRDEATAAAIAALETFGLTARANARPHELTRRERHLGALARSLAMEAELLLWDRPLDDLDAASLAAAVAALGELLERPRTTLLVVGDDAGTAAVAPDLVRLEGGRLLSGGAA